MNDTIITNPTPEERTAAALERIAFALERISKAVDDDGDLRTWIRNWPENDRFQGAGWDR